MEEDQNISGVLSPEPPPGFHHKPVAYLTAPGKPHLRFTTFERLNFCSKTDIGKTAWINACIHSNMIRISQWRENHCRTNTSTKVKK